MDAPNFLTAPEDLCRLTVPKDLRSCIASLSRLLGAGRPSFQESRWAQQAIFAAAPDQWFELRLGGKVTGYMQASKSHGRYSHTRPEKVTDAYGAKRAYTFLASAMSGDQSTEYQRLANVSDEQFVSAVTALECDFANSMDWRYVLAHRREIERERRQKGECAAKRLADEYIGMSMLYPTFFRPFLLGTTATLTLRVTT